MTAFTPPSAATRPHRTEEPPKAAFTPPLWAAASIGAHADPAFYAGQLARHAPAEAEAIVDWLVDRAVRRWTLDEATFWQRVRYQARLVRARSGLVNR